MQTSVKSWKEEAGLPLSIMWAATIKTTHWIGLANRCMVMNLSIMIHSRRIVALRRRLTKKKKNYRIYKMSLWFVSSDEEGGGESVRREMQTGTWTSINFSVGSLKTSTPPEAFREV